MDYSEVCQGWIYIITNKVNGNMYVGKTNNFTQRKWAHFNTEKCPALKNAFNKYGIENFEMTPILTFKAINKEVLNSVLIWLEKYYIEKYETFGKGYNVTKGGEGLLGYKHTDEQKQHMSKIQKEYKAQEWVKQRDRERMLGNTLSEEYKRPILRYTIDGEFIKEYSWIGEAIDDIAASGDYSYNWRSLHSNIIRALGNEENRQHCNKAYNCIWKYKESDNYPLVIEPYRRKKEKPVYHYTKEGQLITSYKTLREAAQKENKTVREIKYLSYNGDLRRKEGKECRKDYWSRTVPE